MRNFDCTEQDFCKLDCAECDKDYARDTERIEQAYFEEKMANDYCNNFNKFNY